MTDAPKRSAFAADSIAAPLRHSVFRRIWLASLVSNLGILIQGVGAAWAMTQMASSADKVALVQTALTLPALRGGTILRVATVFLTPFASFTTTHLGLRISPRLRSLSATHRPAIYPR